MHDWEIVGPARIDEAGRELGSAKGQQECALLNQRELERPLGGFLVDLDLPRRGRLLLGRLLALARACAFSTLRLG